MTYKRLEKSDIGSFAQGEELKNLTYIQNSGEVKSICEGLIPEYKGWDTAYINVDNGTIEELWVSYGFRLTAEYCKVFDSSELLSPEKWYIRVGLA